MARKTDKTLAQLAQEAEDKLNKLKARVARENAKESPALQQLYTALEEVNTEIAANSRALNGDNSFAVRLQTEQNKIAWIQAESDYVEANDQTLREQKTYLQGAIDSMATSIASDENFEADADSVLDNMPTDDHSMLAGAAVEAEAHWRNNTPAAIKKRKTEEKQAQQSIEAGE